MDAVWIGSPNYTAGRSGQVLAIVDHIAQGTAAGLDGWFRNRASQVSAHYGVMRDGSVHQYVDEGDTAWHAGRTNRPEALPWLPEGANPNEYSIGIEHEGWSGELLTPEQFEATVELHREICERHGIPVDGDHIVGHWRLDTVQRAGCPGTGFPWGQLFEALNPQHSEGLSQPTEEILVEREELTGVAMTEEQGAELRAVAAEVRALGGRCAQYAGELRDLQHLNYETALRATDGELRALAGRLEGLAS